MVILEFLILFSAAPKYNLSFSIKHLSKVYKDIELIIYASNQKFFIKNLIKIPSTISPINFNAQGFIIDKKIIDKRILNGKNWLLGFSNFDVR